MDGRSTRPRKHQIVQQPENQSRAKWTTSLTKILADLMVDQIQKGNVSNKSFSKKGWKCICDDFRVQTGYSWDNDQLKSRYVALRKQYINVSLLFQHPDFNWDETTGAIIATEEAWNRYIKEHPDVEYLRSVGCPIYNQLRIIFSEPRTNNRQNRVSKDYEGIFYSYPSPVHLAVEVEEELSPSESEKYTDPANRKRGRRGIEDAIARGILEMAAATKLRAEAIKKLNSKFSITDCIKALDELHGVDDQVYLTALDLFDNHNARETFLTLKVEKRIVWLRRKCLISAHP